MSRRERKAYNEGRRLGYAEGYSRGIVEGNPFNKMIDSVRQLAESAKAMKRGASMRKGGEAE